MKKIVIMVIKKEKKVELNKKNLTNIILNIQKIKKRKKESKFIYKYLMFKYYTFIYKIRYIYKKI